MKLTALLAPIALVSSLFTVACQSADAPTEPSRPAGEAVQALGVSAYEVTSDAPLTADLFDGAGEFRGEFMTSSEGDLESFTMTTKAGDVLDLEFNGGGVALTYNGVETGARAVRSDLDLLLAVASDEALYTDASASPVGLEESRQALRSRCTDNANGTTTCCTRLSCVTF